MRAFRFLALALICIGCDTTETAYKPVSNLEFQYGILHWNDGLATNDPESAGQKLTDLIKTGNYDLIGISGSKNPANIETLLNESFAGKYGLVSEQQDEKNESGKRLVVYKLDKFELADANDEKMPSGLFCTRVVDKNNKKELAILVDPLLQENGSEQVEFASKLRDWTKEASIPMIAMGDGHSEDKDAEQLKADIKSFLQKGTWKRVKLSENGGSAVGDSPTNLSVASFIAGEAQLWGSDCQIIDPKLGNANEIDVALWPVELTIGNTAGDP